MKKLSVVSSLTVFLTFLGLFLYLYRSSGKFRKSIIAAFAATTFFFSGPTTTRALGEADAFSSQSQPSRPSHRSGFFSGKSSDDGSGSGKPNGNDGGGDYDGGKPHYTGPESVQDTAERAARLDEYMRELMECHSAEQLQVSESYKSNSALKKVTKQVHQSKFAMKNLNDIKQKLREGKNPMEIGHKSKSLGNDFYYIRKKYTRTVIKIDSVTGNSNIVACGLRSDRQSMKKMVEVVNSQYDTKTKIDPNYY